MEPIDFLLYELTTCSLGFFVAVREDNFEKSLHQYQPMIFVQARLKLIRQEVKLVDR